MIFGKHTLWRLLSPVVAVAWVVAVIGFASTAHADSSDRSARDSAPGQQVSAQETTTPGAAETHPQPAETHPQPASTTKSDAAPSGSGTTDHGGTSGDVTSPQPISNADANSGGANGQCPGGPYCSTRDGSPSANGSGTGKATGKPCAGCVGKADNKNPKGQMPDASDANAGYECDTNHGIAKGNPAHTGCVTSTPECVPTEENPCVPPECVPTDENPCVSPPECVPTDENPCVSPPECVPTADVPCVSPPQAGPPVTPQVSPPASTTARGLPNTGAPAHLVGLAALAVASLLAGIGLLQWRRHQFHSTVAGS